MTYCIYDSWRQRKSPLWPSNTVNTSLPVDPCYRETLKTYTRRPFRPPYMPEPMLETPDRTRAVCLMCTPVSDVHLSVPICKLSSEQLSTWYMKCPSRGPVQTNASSSLFQMSDVTCHRHSITRPCWTNSEPRSSNSWREWMGDGRVLPASGYDHHRHFVTLRSRFSGSARAACWFAAAGISSDFDPLCMGG